MNVEAIKIRIFNELILWQYHKDGKVYENK